MFNSYITPKVVCMCVIQSDMINTHVGAQLHCHYSSPSWRTSSLQAEVTTRINSYQLFCSHAGPQGCMSRDSVGVVTAEAYNAGSTSLTHHSV